MEKPIRPRIPEECKLAIVLTEEINGLQIKAEIEKSGNHMLFVKDGVISATNKQNPSYAKYIEDRTAYKALKAKWESEESVRQLEKQKAKQEKTRQKIEELKKSLPEQE